MGKIRPTHIKRTARNLIQLYPDKFSTDYKQNREIIQELIVIESRTMRNKIAGYITSLLKQKERE